MLETNNFRAAANLLPSTVKGAVGQPPICDIMRITGRSQVVRFIEFELVKITALISVGNNLNDSQVQFIATQLVEFFPNESLADFKLCFERGCMGQYNRTKKEDIFRLDGIVIRQWMEQYLDEKYQHVEEQLKKEKDKTFVDPKEIKSDSKWLAEWKASIDKIESKKAKPMSQSDILREGQSEPPERKGIFYPSTPLEEIKKKERHLQYIQRNYDAKTAEKLPDWIPEEEFNKLYDEGLI